jgi:hypothetical protein
MAAFRPRPRPASRPFARLLRKSFRPAVENLEDRVMLDSGMAANALPPPIDTSVHIINGLYETLLNRTPQPDESNFWAVELHRGLTPAAAAQDILASPEHLSNLIRQGYESWLGRQPDPPGLHSWQAGLEAGLTGAQFTAGVLASREYQAIHGGNGPDWLTALVLLPEMFAAKLQETP